MMAGAALAGANDDDLDALCRIASKVGIAFQIRDDILDVTSTMEELGKPVFSDEKNEKTTYVTMFGTPPRCKCPKIVTRTSYCGYSFFTRSA